MKPKYKLGTLIEFNTEEVSRNGTVTGIILRTGGVFYEVQNYDESVPELDVVAAYRLQKPSAPRAKTSKKNKATRAEAKAA